MTTPFETLFGVSLTNESKLLGVVDALKSVQSYIDNPTATIEYSDGVSTPETRQRCAQQTLADAVATITSVMDSMSAAEIGDWPLYCHDFRAHVPEWHNSLLPTIQI